MKEWLTDPSVKLALAGAAGGIVRWFTVRDRMWPDGVINIIVGAICAIYLSPLAVPLLEKTVGKIVDGHEQIASLSGFAIGVGGLTISGFIMDFWRARRNYLVGKKGGFNGDD